MPLARIATAVAASLAFLACSSGGDGGSSGADVAAFTEACVASSNLDRPICECAGKKAKAELSANGFAFLTASLGQDEAKIEELRTKLSVQEAMQAGTFMVRGPAACAQEGAGAPADAD